MKTIPIPEGAKGLAALSGFKLCYIREGATIFEKGDFFQYGSGNWEMAVMWVGKSTGVLGENNKIYRAVKKVYKVTL